MKLFDSFKSNSTIRLLTGGITAIIVLSCVIRGGLPLLLLVLIFVTLGAREYVGILKNKGFFPFFKVLFTIGVLLTLFTALGSYDLIPPLLVCGTIASFLAVLFRGRQPYIANVATTILGFFFIWLPSHIILLRQLNADDFGLFNWHFNDGLYFILLLFFVILATDTGAYYIGSKFGKHKLAEVISPKKTIEGTIGGSVCAIAVSMFFGYVIHLEWYHSLIAGILITAFAQLGDLSESLIKRDAGVKDSGDSLPGHGGFLDRADSYLFSTPVAYYYFKFFVINNFSIAVIISYFKKVLHVIGF